MYTINSRFEWDASKAKSNSLKHGISFQVATFAFDDPYALIIDDVKHSLSEKRQWILGDSEYGILVIVFSIREKNIIRIISARHANKKEKYLYEKNKRI